MRHNIPIIYSRIIISAVGHHANAMRGLLQNAEPPDSQAYMSAAQYGALLQMAQTLSKDPLIIIKAAGRTPFSVHGPVGIAAMSSETLGDALRVICQYGELRSPFCHMDLRQDSNSTCLRFEIDASMQEQKDAALDFIVSTLASSVASSVAQPLSAPRLDLRRAPPEYARQYQELLGLPVRFGCVQDAFVFRHADLRIPFIGANREEFAKAQERLRKIYVESRSRLSLREALINVFVSHSGHLCSLEESAQALCMSPRSLQRKLKLQASSFKAERDAWLGEQAAMYLQRERLPVEVTATLLGYSDTANFRRSFKRWFNLAPSQYLAQVATADAGSD